MRSISSFVLVASLLATTNASAAFLRVGGVALPGQGFVTTQPLAIEERFDGPGFPTISAFTFPFGTPGVRTPGENVAGQHLAPRVDSAGYLAVGRATGSTVLTITLNGDYRYVGFDWGSIDEYNLVRFLDSAGQPIFFESFGTQISGLALTEFLELPLYSSLYIDFSFFRSPIPRQIQFVSTNNAFELDNLAFAAASIAPDNAVFSAALDQQFNDPVWSSLPARPDPFADPLPAPASLGALGVGLGLLGARSRRP